MWVHPAMLIKTLLIFIALPGEGTTSKSTTISLAIPSFSQVLTCFLNSARLFFFSFLLATMTELLDDEIILDLLLPEILELPGRPLLFLMTMMPLLLLLLMDL